MSAIHPAATLVYADEISRRQYAGHDEITTVVGVDFDLGKADWLIDERAIAVRIAEDAVEGVVDFTDAREVPAAYTSAKRWEVRVHTCREY